ncbi:MAG: TraR/DksA C4-type zinc finger protein [Proteobacteria bacterium]|nr:TraR/DksA C4-type zinc finger protein [Pseudomonadota bacterium]
MNSRNSNKGEKNSLPESVDNPCIDCGCEIPQARIDNVPGAVRCAPCQSKFEEDNPDSVAREVEEKFGTREDFKNMRNKQFGTNIHNKN